MLKFFYVFILLAIPSVGFSQGKVKNSNPEKGYFTVIEEQPLFPGGEKELWDYLSSKAILPANLKSDSTHGKVFVTFIVDKDGFIKMPKILRGINPVLDSIAVEIIKNMPQWQPGKMKGVPVDCHYNVPIIFDQSIKTKN